MPRLSWAPLGPLRSLSRFALVVLVACTASRLLLALRYLGRVRPVDDAWWLVPIGVRVDTMMLAPVLMPPALVLLLWPAVDRRLPARVVATYLAAVAGAMTFLEIATVGFLAEYDSRPNRVFLDYLAYPAEVVPTVWGEQRALVVGGLIVVALVVAGTWRAMRRGIETDPQWSPWTRLAALPLVALVLFGLARSTLSHRPANISAAAFTADHLTNELALNSSYAVGYALYERRHELDPGALYGHLPRAEALARVRRATLLPAEAFTRSDLPLLHRQVPATPRAQPLNLVILLEESLGAQFVGSLGGEGLTPNLDRLADEGLFFTDLYATGTRTVRGIEAVVCGFPPTPSSGITKLGLAQHGFFTLAALLARHGYATDFLYGGASNFDNMRGFFLGNGFTRALDGPSFESPVFRGTWGVSDEDLVRRAHETFVAHRERPFFALVLTTSNHSPFEYPPGRVATADEPPRHGAIRYADYAIGELFRLAKQADYYGRTVFLVVADHDTRVYGADLVPLEHFRIPGLIIAPGLAPRRYDGVASQIDLPPTVLGLLGVETEHPMPGRDLLAVPPGVPGRALMQYDRTHAYRVGDDVVIHQPRLGPQQFTVGASRRLEPAALDPEMARDALAHVQLPATLYHERRYALPEAVAGAPMVRVER